MDKLEFVREAPIFYALAIATQLSRAGDATSRQQLSKEFVRQFDDNDPDSYEHLLNDGSLWERGIMWLRERGMVTIRTFAFAPEVYARGNQFSEKWDELTRGDGVFGVYGRMRDGDSWLVDALGKILREAERLKISEVEFSRLDESRPRVLDQFNEPDMRPVSNPPGNFVDQDDESNKEAVLNWFYENFEDPVHSTPYNSQEGGYLYIKGGPYAAREIITVVFGNIISDDLIEEIVDEINRESDIWVPSSSRLLRPEEDKERALPAEYSHEQMVRRVAELKELLNDKRGPAVGIGHNKPPEPIDEQPLNPDQKQELEKALDVLAEQPLEPTNAALAKAALETVNSTKKMLADWARDQSKIFADEAIKEAGKQFGRWAPITFWAVVLDSIFQITRHADAWLKAIGGLLH
jgi:hypothetical protein